MLYGRLRPLHVGSYHSQMLSLFIILQFCTHSEVTFSYKMPSGSGQVSPVDSLDGDNEERDQQTGKINIINSTLLSQLTSNSPLPVYKPAPSYRLVSHYMGQWPIRRFEVWYEKYCYISFEHSPFHLQNYYLNVKALAHYN